MADAKQTIDLADDAAAENAEQQRSASQSAISQPVTRSCESRDSQPSAKFERRDAKRTHTDEAASTQLTR
jgi:hypothetical protein